MRFRILLLTDLQNEQAGEDIFLAKALSKTADIILSHPLDCEAEEDHVDLIVVRNIWPMDNYREEWEEIKERWMRKNVKVYNALSGSGDMCGKGYLADLWKKGYGVIPSINDIKDLEKLPVSKYYLLKLLYGGSSKGIEKLTNNALQKRKIKNVIIQPFIDFEYETSFYFIDKKFQYELVAERKRWDLVYRETKAEDKLFAETFVQWNTLEYGVQRIDAGRTKDGKLLLLEIEDFCPYLSLQDISKQLSEKFIKNLTHALKEVYTRRLL